MSLNAAPSSEPEWPVESRRRLSEATKTNTVESRNWKLWVRQAQSRRAKDLFVVEAENPATVRYPSFRQTILCTAIAHSRRKIHANFYRGNEWVPYSYNGLKRISTLEYQEKVLKNFLQSVEFYGSLSSVKAGHRKPAELSSAEVEDVRKILVAVSQKPVDCFPSA